MWRKVFVTTPAESPGSELDSTFADHARGMGGYGCDGYGSREQFFATHFDPLPRLQYYDTFLTAHLPKRGRTLSIASGRAANEMRLGDQGFQIVCSDLEPVCAEPIRALFPHYRFIKWDALNDPIPGDRFDGVMCLSFVYLLRPDVLDAFFDRVCTLLSPGGIFVLDSACSPDHPMANFLHDVVLPVDAYAMCTMLNLRARLRGGERRIVSRKHHGYRYSDAEFTAAAARAGLAVTAITHLDFENEWMRMYLYRYTGARIPFIRAAMRRLGRRIPYVRMFSFRRT